MSIKYFVNTSKYLMYDHTDERRDVSQSSIQSKLFLNHIRPVCSIIIKLNRASEQQYQYLRGLDYAEYRSK